MHTTVLLHETIEGLALKKGEVVLDLTLGDGGHAYQACRDVGAEGRVVGIDQDMAAIDRASKRLTEAPCSFTAIQANFRTIDHVLTDLELPQVDKIIADLGLRTGHLEESGRGFTFKDDQPLLMTFDSSPGEDVLTAYEIVNTWSEDELTEIIRDYGEERFARKIAQAIVTMRKEEKIATTGRLVEAIEQGVPKKAGRGRLPIATKTFQAIRMATNDEVGALEEMLEKAAQVLAPKGRIAIITFHSIEDRIVKHTFKALQDKGGWTIITKRPILPSKEEREENSRSRSAKLRIIEKTV